MHSNQWDCFICIDKRLHQKVFFVFVKVDRVRGKGRLSSHIERCWSKNAFLLYKTNDSMLSCVCSVIDHRRCQNVVRTSVTPSAIVLCAIFLFLPHFDVICDLLLNRRMATWNLFVNFIIDWAKNGSLIFASSPTASNTKDINLTWLPLANMHYSHIWHDYPWPWLAARWATGADIKNSPLVWPIRKEIMSSMYNNGPYWQLWSLIH